MKMVKWMWISLVVVLIALCADQRDFITQNEEVTDAAVCLLTEQSLSGPAGEITEPENYLTDLVYALSYDVPPSSSTVGERNTNQYVRVRKVFALGDGFYGKLELQLVKKNIVLFNGVNTGNRYEYPRDFYIVLLKKIRC